MKTRLFTTIFSAPGMTGTLLISLGLLQFILGIQLINLKGSWYYALSGLAISINGLFLIYRRRESLWCYGLIFITTAIWAFKESGLDGWKLFPHLLTPSLLGIWLCFPWIAKQLHYRNDSGNTAWLGAIFYTLCALFIIVDSYQTTDYRYKKWGNPAEPERIPVSLPYVADDEWRFYGRTADGNRFSPLQQITSDNVSRLKVAWIFRTGDLPKVSETKKGKEFNYEATPIKIGNSLYLCTPHRHVLSINATTGQKNWEFDPHNNSHDQLLMTCRGVAYFEQPQTGHCSKRIISTTSDGRVFELDAVTGKLCLDFGQQGFLNLAKLVGPLPPDSPFMSSPPLVIKNRLILGGWFYNSKTHENSGFIRAYHPVNGTLIWTWEPDISSDSNLLPQPITHHPIPKVLGTYTADPFYGLVYLPLGQASGYFNRKHPPLDKDYSTSILALDIETGKERWHYQTVHDDVWNLDVPIGPSLVDLPTAKGSIIPAIVQPTKRGEFFLLDRRTGTPLTPIQEQSVPHPSTLTGQHLAPTQPYPAVMPSLAPATIKENDTWGITPLDHLLCRLDFRKRHYQGQFTPLTSGESLGYPAFNGIIDWYGISIDPTRKLLIANSSYMPMAIKILTRDEAVSKSQTKLWSLEDSAFEKIIPLPNASPHSHSLLIKPWLNILDVPCIAPPWGRLTAIDLATKKLIWQRPLGTSYSHSLFRIHAGPALPTGIFNKGGNIITRSGLIFIAATADNYFRAFDEKTGQLLWEYRLPAGGQATPMTYIGEDKRQYIVLVAGGNGGLNSRSGDYVIAFALPTLK